MEENDKHVTNKNSFIYEAAYDYHYLLTKKYPSKASLNLVVTRYSLKSKDRLLLYRCIHSAHYIDEINKKLICRKLKGYKMFIDFYNVLISSINMLQNGDVYLCDDCVPRDLRGSKLRPHDDYYIDYAMNIIIEAILRLEPDSVTIIADKNLSFSLNYVTQFSRILKNKNIINSYELSTTPDKKIIEYSINDENIVVATTDSVVMMHSLRITPLTYVVMNILNVVPTYDFTSLFNKTCSVCYENLICIEDKNCERNT